MKAGNWNNYIEYLKDWARQHEEIENEGMSPVCYDEFLDNEKEVDNYIKKEEYVGLYAEWADEDTDEDRREDIEFELHDLYYELVVDYGDIKPSKLYEKLVEEITK